MKTRAAMSKIGRARDRILVDALIKSAARHGGKLTEEVAYEACREAYQRGHSPLKPGTALEVVINKIKTQPNIRLAIMDIFETLDDFTMEDAVKMHVRHIKGEAPPKASYAALKDYENMTLPMPAKKVEVGLSVGNLGAQMMSVPPVSARALGPAIVEDVIESQVVELEDEPS